MTSISVGARASVLALQGINAQMAQFQLRLSTGKKVNDPTDNPMAYFTAAALDAQAGALSSVIDNISTVGGAISAANAGIDAIQTLARSAQTLASSALASSDPTQRAAYATQYNSLLSQIDSVATDSSFNGINLLTGGSTTATFNADGTSSYTISGVNANSAGLGLTAVTDFSSNTEINTSISQLSTSLASLSGMSSSFSTADSVLALRKDFSNSMVSFLNSAASDLTASDPNADGAALLALQTRQQIASTALTFTSNADANVLRLFGLSKQTFG